MKKGLMLLLSALLAVPSVCALDFLGAGETLVGWVQQIFSPFFEALIGTNQFDQYFFARVLFLILIYAVVLISLKNIDFFKNNKGVTIIVAAIVSILGVRYLSQTDFVTWILIPYGTFAAAILVLLPFVIYFFFVNSAISSQVGRRMAWIIFALVFFGLWISRINDLGGISNLSNMSVMNWIYIAGIILVAISFVFDRQIQRYFGLHEISKWKKKEDNSEVARLQAEYHNIKNVDSPHANKRKEDILSQLKKLGASV